jgi:hypothetical protein
MKIWTLHKSHLKTKPQSFSVHAFPSAISTLDQVDWLHTFFDPFAGRVATGESSRGSKWVHKAPARADESKHCDNS